MDDIVLSLGGKFGLGESLRKGGSLDKLGKSGSLVILALIRGEIGSRDSVVAHFLCSFDVVECFGGDVFGFGL